MSAHRVKQVLKALPSRRHLPFSFAETQSTESSLKSSENSSFFRELAKASPAYEVIQNKNPVKRQQSPSPPDKGLPFRRRARSNSPNRKDLAIAQPQNSLFPEHKPVIAQKVVEDSFSGIIYERGQLDVEEDEDLKLIKEMYCKMLENESEDEFESIQEEASVNTHCHVGNWNSKIKQI